MSLLEEKNNCKIEFNKKFNSLEDLMDYCDGEIFDHTVELDINDTNKKYTLKTKGFLYLVGIKDNKEVILQKGFWSGECFNSLFNACMECLNHKKYTSVYLALDEDYFERDRIHLSEKEALNLNPMFFVTLN